MPDLDWTALYRFLLLWLFIVPTPGPNSLMVVHTALTHRPRHLPVAISANVLGVLFWATCAVFGLTVMLEAAPAVRKLIHILGGAYLIYFAYRLLRRSWIAPGDRPEDAPDALVDPPLSRSFSIGLATALSNAQAIFFMTSIYAVTGITNANVATALATLVIIAACNGVYLLALGWLLRRPAPRTLYARHRRWLERLIGVAFLIFGGRLMLRELSGGQS